MYDEDKVDEMVLALLHLNAFNVLTEEGERRARELFEEHFGTGS